MLPADEYLDATGRDFERARTMRRTFQGIVIVLVVAVTALVAAVGVERLVSAYAFVALWLGFNEAQRRVLRRVGETTNIEVSSEVARATPFAALVSYVVAWIGSGELLVGTGALSEPFGVRIQYVVSGVLAAAALASTWRPQAVALHDRMAAVMWLALLVPTVTATPRTAWWVMSVGRVVIAIALHLVLMARSELRVAPSKLHNHDGPTALASLASVTRVAANNAARKLVQVAWIMSAWPPLTVGLSVVIIFLNEYVGTAQPRHDTSPPPSPRRYKEPSSHYQQRYESSASKPPTSAPPQSSQPLTAGMRALQPDCATTESDDDSTASHSVLQSDFGSEPEVDIEGWPAQRPPVSATGAVGEATTVQPKVSPQPRASPPQETISASMAESIAASLARAASTTGMPRDRLVLDLV